jgi:replicative DNA helicase
LNKECYINYRNYVDKKLLSLEVSKILTVLDELQRASEKDISLSDLEHITLSKENPFETYQEIFSVLEKLEQSFTIEKLLESIKNRKLLEDISAAAYDASKGFKEVTDILSLVDKLTNPVDETVVEYVTDDLEDILSDTVKTPGLRWRLNMLNKSLGSLRKGDFGFLFARPETGKTTFLASEVSFMAEQAFQKGAGPVLWFNNEERGKKVKLRVYQAVLGARVEHLLSAPERAKAAYVAKVGQSIKLFDSSLISKYFVETVCAKEKPSLVVFDQLDKVTGFKGDRTDLVLGEIYTWARSLAKEYCPVIGVSQADGTAEGIDYLEMSHVANAKTAKQAEADWILGIGKKPEAAFDLVRYFHICKNKLSGDGIDMQPNLRHGRFEVLIKADIARYADI